MENTQYNKPSENLFKDKDIVIYKETMEECIEYCRNNFPGEAKYFSWNEDESGAREKFWNSCRCKKTELGKRTKRGVFSGNLDCTNPVQEPGELLEIMMAFVLKNLNLEHCSYVFFCSSIIKAWQIEQVRQRSGCCTADSLTDVGQNHL